MPPISYNFPLCWNSRKTIKNWITRENDLIDIYYATISSETKSNAKHITEDPIVVDFRNGIIQTYFSNKFSYVTFKEFFTPILWLWK